jgi:SAM-dependent methyltransferase
MNYESQTWHHGLMARHWAENNTTGPEIAYYQRKIEQYGQPALDAGCGTGRLLIPFLRAGLDVDGIDISADMLAYCQKAAEREGFKPHLYHQALHQLDVPRQYQTIIVCGVFGLGSDREQDVIALQRFYKHLLPGGVLLLEVFPRYSDPEEWALWCKGTQAHLPVPWNESIGTPQENGPEYELHYRLVSIDPLEQRVVKEMRTLLFKDQQLVSDVTLTLTENAYFRNEMLVLLKHAGFTIEAELSGWTNEPATADDDTIVIIARK